MVLRVHALSHSSKSLTRNDFFAGNKRQLGPTEEQLWLSGLSAKVLLLSTLISN